MVNFLSSDELERIAAPSPMLDKYREARRTAPAGAVVVVRLGDFYEGFADDAEPVSELSGAALSSRPVYGKDGHPCGRLLMAGVVCRKIDGLRAAALASGRVLVVVE